MGHNRSIVVKKLEEWFEINIDRRIFPRPAPRGGPEKPGGKLAISWNLAHDQCILHRVWWPTALAPGWREGGHLSNPGGVAFWHYKIEWPIYFVFLHPFVGFLTVVGCQVNLRRMALWHIAKMYVHISFPTLQVKRRVPHTDLPWALPLNVNNLKSTPTNGIANTCAHIGVLSWWPAA